VIAVGRSRVASIGRPTGVDLARRARDLVRARVQVGAGLPRVEVALRAHGLTAAWEQLDHHALLALVRVPPAGGCSWCCAFVAAVAVGADEPASTEVNRELLGSPCAGCVRRQNISRARAKGAAQARQEAALVAAGHLPPARRCAECRAWTPARPLLASAAAVVPLAGPSKRCGACNGWVPAVTAAEVAAARARLGERAIDDVMAGPPIWQPRRRSIAASRAAGTYRVLPPGRRG
jgi:hypothetical protein